MDDLELCALFSGYGYQVRFVEDLDNIDQDMAASMDWALKEIRHIQEKARSGDPIIKPRWPVLIMRTPKGWSGPKKLRGEFVEGSFKAHQVPLPAAKTDKEELADLQQWLESYDIQKLIDLKSGSVDKSILEFVPKVAEKRLGQRKEAYASYEPLDVPSWIGTGLAAKSGNQESCMKVVGKFLLEVMKRNPTSFRIFSPDELVSNKLDAVLEHTGRNFQWDSESRANGGRVIEILSEHTCQGMLQGYTLTGRTGLFPSYESFLGIIHTMMVQYGKFIKMAQEIPWRQPVGSLNYIETSTWTRQEHNGFSHQNPSFIGAVLNLKSTQARVYLPPDANCFLSTVAHCLRAKNYVNLMVGSKAMTSVWLSPEEADEHCVAGASVWKFASTEEGVNPDVVLVGIGVELTFEVIAAAALLRRELPELRVRVINVTDLMILSPERTHPHSLTDEDFETLFTPDKEVVVNYHGYPSELKGLVFGRKGAERMSVEGYNEEGTTTTPFDMMLLNRVSRFHVAAKAVAKGAKGNPKVAPVAHEKQAHFMHLAQKEKEYAYENGIDRTEIYATPEFE